MMNRNDTGMKKDCPRSNRMFIQQNGWYFKTREEYSVGPFRDELEASTQLEIYIRLVEAGLLQSVTPQPLEQPKQQRVG